LTQAQFVLSPLLGRNDLTPDDAPPAIQHALHWLDQHGTLTQAQFVLPPLLDRNDVPADVMDRAVDIALAWLQEYGDTVGAGFVLPPLLARRKLTDLPQWLSPLIDRWADQHRSTPHVDFVSKQITRQKALTETTADVVLQWAATHPEDVDIPWRLTGIATGIDRYPSLTGRLLRSVEGYLDAVEHDTAEVNGHGQLDGLVQALCRRHPLRCGIAGARLDDIVLRWLAHPSALNPNCPKGSQFSEAARRVQSLVWAGRFTHQGAVDVLTRLHRWIPRWRVAEPHVHLRDAVLRETAALLAALTAPAAVQQLRE
ncbi:hypothetical protein, partial [Micromonospora sediminimaris]|uniref:hypothetical protein n=1 Tax=Micromonospora sediminimaris TaxID=547162 RepID=UPI00194F3B97